MKLGIYNHVADMITYTYTCSSKRGVKLPCLVHQSLAEQTPSYLASDIQLTTNTSHPQLRSASGRICVVPRTHNSFGDKFFSCRSSCVERLAIISAAGHELQPLQACTERTCLCYSRPRRTVTNLLSCTLEAYLLTYLLTYLFTQIPVALRQRGWSQRTCFGFFQFSVHCGS